MAGVQTKRKKGETESEKNQKKKKKYSVLHTIVTSAVFLLVTVLALPSCRPSSLYISLNSMLI